ncbi:MAG TPA: tetratricopeptide repeat protein [Terriglobia bacterium]|nr:tetratricopeptide repeat protein [Terriglobia bacterium]
MKRNRGRYLKAHLDVLKVIGVCVVCASQAAAQRFPGTVESEAPHTASLEGRVRVEGGQTTPSGVMIRLETSEGQIAAEQPANGAGEFEFSDLSKVVYVVTVTAQGYQTWQQTMDLGRGANKFIVNVTLTPLGKARPAPTDLPSLTDANAPKKARKEYEKGAHALEARNLSGARGHFEKAVEEYPCYARAQTDLALTLSSQHELAPAETALRKALECDPGFLNAYTELGQLLNAEKKYTDSQTVLQAGLRRSPSSWQFYSELGAAFYGLGHYQEAEGEYLKAQSLSAAPLPEVDVKLADVYLKETNYSKAYAAMQAYLQIEPNGRFAAKIKNIMHQMESSGVLGPAQAQTTSHPPSQP